MPETFGQGLRRLREDAGLSQPALARRVPVSQSSLSRYESDRQAVDPDTAARLDDLLHASGTLSALRHPTAAEMVLTRDDQTRIARHIAYPSRVDHATVTALADVLAAQRRLDDTLGPALLIPTALAQMATITGMVRHARGAHRDELVTVAAEYVQFAGWLHAEARRDGDALHLLTEAEDLADEVGSGVLAAQAANFKGYLARQRGNPRGVVRWFMAAHLTPGAHMAQRVGDAAQAAQGYAEIGERDEALRLLDVAGHLIDEAARDEPPATAYWLTPTFHRLNVGLAHLSLADYGTAADHIAAGMGGLPEDQVGAEWTAEYRNALDTARSAR
jgi:transcriptional regulator with XRE-family HTH domain